MPRKSRPLDRTSGVLRDTSIIVVACEDTHAVKQYFAKFRTRRVQYKVLPTVDGNSSPRAVLERLNDYKEEYATEKHDELWICIDADHWIRGGHQAELSQVLRECRSKGYGVAISNPCFEVWLLLHFTQVDDTLLLECVGKAATDKLTDAERASVRCDKFEAQLRKLAGSYNKSNVTRLAISPEQVELATERARDMDGDSDVRACPGTRVYKLMDTLRRRDSIDLEPNR